MGFFRMGLTLTFLNAVVMEPLMIAVMNGIVDGIGSHRQVVGLRDKMACRIFSVVRLEKNVPVKEKWSSECVVKELGSE